MRSFFIFLSLFLLSFQQSKSQNIDYAREVLNILCSENFHGRGYAMGGAEKTSEYIKKELKKQHLKKFDKSYFQTFKIHVNTFSGNNFLSINNKKLIPGIDFLISSSSDSLSGNFSLKVINAALINAPEKFKKFIISDFSDKVILIDTFGLNSQSFNNAYQLITERNILRAKAIIKVTREKLIYVPSQIRKSFPLIILRETSLPENPTEVTIDIDSKYYSAFETKNIIAYIKGKIDTSIVFAAHYDHLGTMGKSIFFPGANDDGSGVASLLTLAKYFSKQKNPKYNIVFMFFSGEELGMLGSYFYTEHPIFPLSKIKFLINLDMVGSGDKGITVVNGSVFKDRFNQLVEINDKNNYLPAIKIRGKAANSDHYFFFEKGVPSFFIYTLGKYKEYHNIFDTPERLPLSKFEGLMHLLIDFTETITNPPKNAKKINIEKSYLPTVQRKN
ncbi:MAG: M28 family peptidase [Chlorobi bacterium]|nr:M28 family peptidase [Chlorobiota bacterium]